MPDPAIDAYNAGMAYTEPITTSFWGRKETPKGKVTLVPDPLDPSAPPRRVIDIDGSKGSWWGRKVGGKGVVQNEIVGEKEGEI